MGEVRNEGRGGLRAVIEEVLATPSTDYVNTLVPPRINERRRIEELATRILDAIEPLIEQKGPAAPDGLDRRFDEVFQFPGPNARMEAAEDRIGDLESWRESTRERFNQTTTDLGLILRRLDDLERRADAFDLKHVASINRDKDINNAIERIDAALKVIHHVTFTPSLSDKNEGEGHVFAFRRAPSEKILLDVVERDLEHFGSAYLTRGADGATRRIDPSLVTIKTEPGKYPAEVQDRIDYGRHLRGDDS